MTELNRPPTSPEFLEGPDYWRELASIIKEIGAWRERGKELEARAAVFARHLTEPVSSPARVYIPESALAHLSRNREEFPGKPRQFEAEGAEVLSLDKLVLFNRSERLWLWIEDPSSDLEIEPIEP